MLYPMKLLPFVAIQQSGAAESESSQILRSADSYRRHRRGDRRHRSQPRTSPSQAALPLWIYHPGERQREGKERRKEPMSAAARPV